MTRVVVTGMGAVTPLGTGVRVYWEKLIAGESGVREIDRFDTSGFSVRIGGDVKDFDPYDYVPKKEARKMDRFIHLGLAATQEAIRQSGLGNGSVAPERIGCYAGVGFGGLESIVEQSIVLNERGARRVNPFLVPAAISNLLPGHISILHKCKGPSVSLASACASAVHALGEAFWVIKRGDADVMITGGAEACLTPLAVAAFANMRALSTRNDDPQAASRPFDKDRDGFVIGEGAGILVIESERSALERGATIFAEVAGYGASSDSYHITATDEKGDGPARAMAMAMDRAGLTPADVGYINAHGTSTPLNDVAETRAIKRVFQEHASRIPISSTKSMTGHLLGAAGGIESIATIMTLLENRIHPTINLDNPDPGCDLDYVPHTARSTDVDVALCNSFGFGGANSCIVFRRYEPTP